ncbi:MAG: GNAT family protein [Burkholderiaceae bacterium]
MSASFSQSITLQGQHALLEPLRLDHLAQASEAVQDGRLWELWYTAIPSPQTMQTEIERRLTLQAQGLMLPFAIRQMQSDGQPGRFAGMTTYMNIDQPNRRLEIGSTWYRKSAQRSALNTECKLLLLGHAFEALNCIAVEFRTHFFNQQSRKGIERLGAKLDGVLRSHQIAGNGTLRDTCVYSIVASEWPTVKAHLQHQLAKPRAN